MVGQYKIDVYQL